MNSRKFVLKRTQDEQPVRTLVVVDDYTRECLVARVGCWLSQTGALGSL